MDNTCVCCGAVIPEGRMVCWACENRQGVSPERRANGTVGAADCRTAGGSGADKQRLVVLQYMPHELVGHYFVEVT